MATTLAPVLLPSLHATPPDSATQFAQNLVEADPVTAERITAALLKALDVSVAAILEASGP